jgi:septum formation protein
MSQVKIAVEIQAPNTDEQPHIDEKPLDLVKRLAREKALSIKDLARKRHQTCLVIAADTIVVSPRGNKILGKPKNIAEANRMLSTLSGKVHTVLTGYCILMISRRKGILKKKVSVVRSQVKMRIRK